MEHDGLGLERAPEAAVEPPVLVQLSDVLGVALARQLDRRPWSVVRRRRVGERSHERQLRIDRRCRRDRLEHARPRRLLDVDVRVVVAITDPHRDHPGCRGCTDCLAAVLGEPVRYRRHEGVVGGLHRPCLRAAGDEDVPCRLRNSGIRRSARWRGDPGRERLQPAFDRGDSVVHRAMHHRAEHARACGRSADHDHARGDAAPVDDGVSAGAAAAAAGAADDEVAGPSASTAASASSATTTMAALTFLEPVMPIPVLLSILVASTARSQIECGRPVAPATSSTDAASSEVKARMTSSDGASKSPRGEIVSRGVLSE